METIINPHDKLFRETWSNRETAQDFLRQYLPREILRRMKLDTLKIAKDSFVDQELRDYFSDVLYKVKFKGRNGYVYLLFEHKSYPDRLIHLQLLEYMLKIWRLYLKQQRRKHAAKRLPIILPIVLYHGPQDWTAIFSFAEMFVGPREMLKGYIPDFHYLLYDLSDYADDEIKGLVLTRVVLLLFKHIRDPDIGQRLPNILALLRTLLEQENGLRCLETVLRYVAST